MKPNLIIPFLICCMSCSSQKKNAHNTTTKAPDNQTSEQALVSTENQETKRVPSSTVWEKRSVATLPDLEKRIEPEQYILYFCRYEELIDQLDEGVTELILPTRSGLVNFNIVNANTMSSTLAAKFPNIRSFKGESIDGLLRLRLDTNDDGLFAEITGIQRKELLAPMLQGNTGYYALYEEKELKGGTPRDASYD